MLKIINTVLPADTDNICVTDETIGNPECKIEIYTDDMGNVYPKDAIVNGNTLCIAFDRQSTAHNIRIMTNTLTGEFNPFSGDYDDLSNKPTLFSGDYDDLSNKPTLFSGDYDDLSNKPDAIDIPFDNSLIGIVSEDVQGAIEEAYNHGGGSSSLNISDEEIVIGTWYGKPLYLKALKTDISSSTGQRSITISNSNIVLRMVSAFACTTYDQPYRVPINFPTYFDSVYQDGGTIMKCSRSNATYRYVELVLIYTKPED